MSLLRICRACTRVRLPMPLIDVPSELGNKQWTYAPAFWYISGESRNRSEGETDKNYVKRVLKNMNNRDRAAALREEDDRDHFARWAGTDEDVKTSLKDEQSEPTEDWKKKALYWQRRCQSTEDRLTSVVTAVGNLSRITEEETSAIYETDHSDEEETFD